MNEISSDIVQSLRTNNTPCRFENEAEVTRKK